MNNEGDMPLEPGPGTEPEAKQNGSGGVALETPKEAEAAVPEGAAPPVLKTDEPTVTSDGGGSLAGEPSDGVAGISALRGLIVYGAVLAFAGLYIYFAVVISKAPSGTPHIDATLVDAAAALAGVLGSAFALRMGNPSNQAVINHGLAAHLRTASRRGAKPYTKVAAYVHRALSLEASQAGATSWPITFGIWAYAAVGSMLVAVYVLNEQQTPGTVKALAVTFAGYVLALLTAVFKSSRSAGDGST